MFFKRLQICRLFGIPVYLDASWLIIFGLITLTLSRMFAEQVPNLRNIDYWLMAAGTAIAFFVCILLHEMGHSLVAQATGQPVAGITLFLFGGVAEMTEPKTALREFAIAIAGPLVSLVLSATFGLLRYFGSEVWSPAALVIFEYLFVINAVVILFNMIPAFPLDGGRVLRSILWAATGDLRRATYVAAMCGSAFAWLLMGVGVYRLLTGDLLGGVWFGIIGLFLHGVAQGSYRQVLVREVLAGEPLSRFMNTEPITVAPDVDLQQWVDDYYYRYQRKTFPVLEEGHLRGVITSRDLAEIPREEWHKHTVGEVMNHDLEACSIAPDVDAMDALRQMQQTGSSRLLVVDDDRLVGIVSLKDLMRFLQLKLEMDKEV